MDSRKADHKCNMTVRHIYLLVILIFMCIFILNFYWLPDLGEKGRFSYLKHEVNRRGHQILHPHPDESEFHLGDNKEDIHRIRDRAQLWDKIANNKGQLNSDLENDLSNLKEDLRELRKAIEKDKDTFVSKQTKKSIRRDVASSWKFDSGGTPPSREETQGGEPIDPAVKLRRDTVRNMMRHAWAGYTKYAWGANEVRPVSLQGHSASIFGSHSLGASIVDGMDTLFIMGLMDEFKEGEKWINEKLNFDVNAHISVFEANIRFIGGLLTLYSFTGNDMYVHKARSLADRLLPAFNTRTGLPLALINLQSHQSNNYGWASGGCSILSEFGTLHMEFAFLSQITENPVYFNKVKKVRQILYNATKPEGLYYNYMNPHSLSWGQHHASLAGLGDSFYEYLLKEWIRTGGKDTQARTMYDEAMKAVEAKMLLRSSPSNLLYVGDFLYSRTQQKMDHLGCFTGGMFALGGATANIKDSKWINYGAEITNTCHESYIRTGSHLGPESFRFDNNIEAMGASSRDNTYILRPETVESYFYLWRITKDPKYRDWAWDAVQAMEKHCKSPGGYSGLQDIDSTTPRKDDVQQSFFLAETLKYLYLIFSEDSLLPLDRWVYNTEAHPFPVNGAVKIPVVDISKHP